MSNKPPTPDMRPVVRLVLTVSSIAMLIAAVLVFLGVLPMPTVIGYLFSAIAVVDMVIAWVVFGR